MTIFPATLFSIAASDVTLPPGRIRFYETGGSRFASKAMLKAGASWPSTFSEADHAEGTLSSRRVYADEVLNECRQGGFR
jgi:hypothetical protein